MKQVLEILAAGLALFVAYLPIALWASDGYVQSPRPVGAAIEPLLRIAPSSGASTYQTHSMVLAKYIESGKQVLLYKELTPLGPAKFVKFTDDLRSFVIFTASDNSDPNTNGRKYWLVLP